MAVVKVGLMAARLVDATAVKLVGERAGWLDWKWVDKTEDWKAGQLEILRAALKAVVKADPKAEPMVVE